MSRWPIAATLSRDQTITTADTSTQGSHPCHAGTAATAAGPPASAVSLIVNSGSGAGRHHCRNRIVTTREPSEDRTSVSL